nr:hypothetical transcript [Hymenolepis microstoma]
MNPEERRKRVEYQLVLDRINSQFTDFQPDTFEDKELTFFQRIHLPLYLRSHLDYYLDSFLSQSLFSSTDNPIYSLMEAYIQYPLLIRRRSIFDQIHVIGWISFVTTFVPLASQKKHIPGNDDSSPDASGDRSDIWILFASWRLWDTSLHGHTA